jgi:hypothetical protein
LTFDWLDDVDIFNGFYCSVDADADLMSCSIKINPMLTLEQQISRRRNGVKNNDVINVKIHASHLQISSAVVF